MSKSKIFVSLILVALLLTLPTTAFAKHSRNNHDDDHSKNTRNVIRETVEWTIPAGVCKEAPNGLAGKGQRYEIIETRVDHGITVVTTNDLVKGTAWDSTGTYHFVYKNHNIEAMPTNGGTHKIHMVDSFELNGKGSVHHLAVSFDWSWTYTPPAESWPPHDNWKQYSTHGDINCDPL